MIPAEEDTAKGADATQESDEEDNIRGDANGTEELETDTQSSDQVVPVAAVEGGSSTSAEAAKGATELGDNPEGNPIELHDQANGDLGGDNQAESDAVSASPTVRLAGTETQEDDSQAPTADDSKDDELDTEHREGATEHSAVESLAGNTVDVDGEEEGDIAAAGMEQLTIDPPPTQPTDSVKASSPSSLPRPRDLSPDKSNSRSPSPRASSNGGPSRQASPSSHRSPGIPTFPVDESNSSSPVKSPRPLPFFMKPTIPVSTPIIVADDDVMPLDDSAPFESIPLQTTPPPPQSATLPSSPRLHPGSPTAKKRSSWSGFGIGNGTGERPDFGEGPSGHIEPVDSQSRSSISTLPPPPATCESGRGTPDAPPPNEKPEAPRLHAPPAHPHPFPIPSTTSPRPSLSADPPHERKPSHSGPGAAGPSTGLGVKGVSTFEKVISHTRPSWLPPKDRTEDETHYHQWEEMMSKAREAEKEKRKVEEAKRAEREKRLAINTPKWEEMLDEKTFSADKIRKDPILRQIWFEGAPTYLRGKAWSLAIGNPLALSKGSFNPHHQVLVVRLTDADLYKSCVARSKKAIASGRFPPDILERIEADLDNTLINLRLFQHGSPLRSDLHELICAWVVYRSDTALGYVSLVSSYPPSSRHTDCQAPYINLLAALLLLSSPPATAFLSLVNLLSRPVLRAFYTETQDEIDAFYRVFENLQADMFPKIFANCKNLGLKVPESWFRSVLVEQVPFEAACRLWDQVSLP